MIDYAPPELAAEMVPRLLRGDETWCQGFSEPGTGSNLGRAGVPGRRARTTAGSSPARRSGRASPSTPSAACCSPAPARPTPPTGASPRCSSTWTRPASPCVRSRRCTARTSSARSSSTTSLVPVRPHARRRGRGLGGGHGPPALRAQHRALAPRRLPAPPPRAAARRGRRARRARRRPRWGRRSSSSSPSGPAPAPPAPPAPAATRSVPRRPSTRSCWPPPSRRSSTSPPTASPRRCCWATTRRASVALRVPVLPGRHDLRRQLRDPAQHRGPPPARPRGRPMMDAEERELFARGIRAATTSHTGEALDAALAGLGWRDALGARHRRSRSPRSSSCRARPADLVARSTCRAGDRPRDVGDARGPAEASVG